MLDNFFHSLEQQPRKPAAICFFTEGVKLVADDSPLLLSLRLLEGLGVRLVVCKSCLAHYGLQDRVAVGQVGGMNDIVGLMAGADKAITL
jgi:intracellular sulfur oxidation DsrE/DsrF family protein